MLQRLGASFDTVHARSPSTASPRESKGLFVGSIATTGWREYSMLSSHSPAYGASARFHRSAREAPSASRTRAVEVALSKRAKNLTLDPILSSSATLMSWEL